MSVLLQFAVDVLLMLVAGAPYAYNTYSVALKNALQLTQTAVNLISSVYMIGFSVTFFCSWVYLRFGPKKAVFGGLIFCMTAQFFIWACINNITPSDSYLVVAMFFMFGQGSIWMYMISLTHALNAFSPRYRGTIVSILDGGFGSSSVLLSGLYEALHTDDKSSDVVLSRYFIASACIFLSIGLLAMTSLTNLLANQYQDIHHAKTKPIPQRSLAFICIVASSFLCYGVLLSYCNDLSSLVSSLGGDYALQTKQSMMFLTASAAGRFTVGLLSDFVKYPRYLFWLGSLLSGIVGFILLIFQKMSLFTTAHLLLGVSIGSFSTLTPVIVVDYFGLKNFNQNWGLCLGVAATASLVYQAIAGNIYDSFATPSKSSKGTLCTGVKCYSATLKIFLLSMSLGLLLAIIGVCRIRHHMDKISNYEKRKSISSHYQSPKDSFEKENYLKC